MTPKRNTGKTKGVQWPYEARHLPFDKRKGLQVWPNGARMAVLIYTVAEEWDWEAASEPQPPPPVIAGARSHGATCLSNRTCVNYAFEVGLRRYRDIMKAHGLRSTIWTTGNSVEQHPEIVRELHEDGFELGGHGYSEGVLLGFQSREDQQENIKKSMELLQSITGERPAGWLGPAASASVDTIDLLAEEGFLYNGDLQDDELPYFIDINGKTLLEIPYRMQGNLNDHLLFSFHSMSVRAALEFLRESFDAHYREASVRPLVLNYGTHPFVSGRADTASVLSGFLDYVQEHNDVWLCTYREMADWWTSNYASGYPV